MQEDSNGCPKDGHDEGSSFQEGAAFHATLLEEIKKRIKPQQYNTWFRRIPAVEYVEADNVIKFVLPNRFYLEWLKTHYLPVVNDAATAIVGRKPEVLFSVHSGVFIQDEEGAAAAPETLPFIPEKVSIKDQISLNPDYSFDNFVVGPCNRLPHAAALSIVDAPALAYNPLFIYGSVGLGKTHLLQATCHALIKRKRDIKILYLSCETFLNHFISSVEKGDLENFRHKYRYVDVLLVDDIHFLAHKERTQEEFFHTFNTLYNSHKQIILSSDSPPKEIPTLEERLVSRFKWGLVTHLEPPSYETRVAIVKKKARIKNLDFPDDVCHFIGANIETNIRELEGAIIKVVGLASLEKKKIDMPLCREALQDLLSRGGKKLSLGDILNAVAAFFSIKVSDLQSKKRSKSIAFPRQICMYIAREKTDCSLEEIGGFLGGRDHTTVIYAIEKIKKVMTKEPQLIDTIERIKKLLKT